MPTPQSSAQSLDAGLERGLDLPAEAPRVRVKEALRQTFLGKAWRALKLRRKEAALRLAPVIARRRAALRADAGARLRALAERNPGRARALARALGPGAAAILTARSAGWAAAAPLFARLAPGDVRARVLLRRGAPGPALALAAPAPDRPADLPADLAAGLVVYTARFGPAGRVLPPIGPIARVRFVCLSDRDDPAEGWTVARFAPPAGVDPALAADSAGSAPRSPSPTRRRTRGSRSGSRPDVLLTGNFDTLVARWLAPQQRAAWRHPRAVGWRDLAEGAALEGPPERRAAALDQALDCEAAGLPDDAGAVDTRFLWRRHGPAAAALAAAWWDAFARHPGDADLALARALGAPGAPAGFDLLPAALGTAEDNLYTAVSPVGPSPAPHRPAAAGRRPGAARLKIAIVHHRGYEHYASTLLRAEQLAGLLDERLGDRYDISYVADIEGLRDHVVVLTKWALERRKPAAIAALRKRNVAVIASWDDKIPTAEIAGLVDAQMTLSIAQSIELGRRFPATPTYFVTHHVNRLIRAGAPADGPAARRLFRRAVQHRAPGLARRRDRAQRHRDHAQGQHHRQLDGRARPLQPALDRAPPALFRRRQAVPEGLPRRALRRGGDGDARRRRRRLLPRRRLSVLRARARPGDARGRLAAHRLRLRRARVAPGRGDHAPGGGAQRRRGHLRAVRGDDRGDHGVTTRRRCKSSKKLLRIRIRA